MSYLYFQNLDDNLGGFLGSMSPEIWVDANSGVPDLYNEWQRITSEISNSQTLTLKESFLAMIKLLNMQYELFDEIWAKNLANEILNNKKLFKKWIDCIKSIN